MDLSLAEEAEAALAVMRAAGSVDPDDAVVEMSRLPDGWSRHSYAMTVGSPEASRDYVVRVKPPGAIIDTDIAQEYRTHEVLRAEPIPTPDVHGLEESEDSPFGGAFFVLDRAPGRAPNVWKSKEQKELETHWKRSRSLGRDLVSLLVATHSVGADRVARVLPVRSYSSLVSGWQSLQESVGMINDPIIEGAYAWLGEREPRAVDACLVHGDYRIGNCMVKDNRICAVLDWELAYCGDPRFDIGYLSLDFVAGPHPQLLGAVADREWFYSEYECLSGTHLDRETVRTFSVLGALMLFAMFSIGARAYCQGRTTDIRVLRWSQGAFTDLRQELTRLVDW